MSICISYDVLLCPVQLSVKVSNPSVIIRNQHFSNIHTTENGVMMVRKSKFCTGNLKYSARRKLLPELMSFHPFADYGITVLRITPLRIICRVFRKNNILFDSMQHSKLITGNDRLTYYVNSIGTQCKDSASFFCR